MATQFKLYYTPTSCGAANFFTAQIGGLAFESEVVDIPTHKTKSGADFYAINPKGNVPTLVFPDGSILNENVATLTYLADQGNAGLAPKEGTPERYRYLNNLGFVATELHPSMGALFNRGLSAEGREAAMGNVQRRLSTFAKMIEGGKAFLNGSSLSTADLYAYIVLSWAPMLGVSLPESVKAYFEGIKANESVVKATAAMHAAS